MPGYSKFVGDQEKIRLVIWDLDETFWKGTLTEGGIQEFAAAKNAVIELANRGIVSSICSKNDYETVRKVLVDMGIWEYFVFPSIAWTPKGHRIAQIIEDVQLRAATVMFVDDNNLNLQEAKSVVSQLQIADPSIIEEMLDHDLFIGKDDRDLTRLKQYKILEARKRDQAQASTQQGGYRQFLRDSKIQVRFEYDVEKHIDRAVELINRTNQLNFTKKRLPENIDEARSALSTVLKDHFTTAALLHVADNYGDHGFCGLYVTSDFGKKLEHFTFSCRILGMGVEAWLYNRLNRPQLTVVGEVLSDPVGEKIGIDWISEVEKIQNQVSWTGPNQSSQSLYSFSNCEMTAAINYLASDFKTIFPRVNTYRRGVEFQLGHIALNVPFDTEGFSLRRIQAAKTLGYTASDFESVLSDHSRQEPAVFFFSFVGIDMGCYRHRETGLVLPLNLANGIPAWKNLNEISEDDSRLGPHDDLRSISYHEVKKNYEWLGSLPITDLERLFTLALEGISKDSLIIILNRNTWRVDPSSGKPYTVVRNEEVNDAIARVTAGRCNVKLIDARNLIEDESEILSLDYFARLFYVRLAKEIVSLSHGWFHQASEKVI